MMTSKLKGVEAYYSTLEVLNAPTTIRGTGHHPTGNGAARNV